VATLSNQPTGTLIGELFANGGMRGAHRAEFHKALLTVLETRGNVSLHTSKRLLRYKELSDGTGVLLHFEDGSHISCDILIGADGLRSAVRSSMVSAIRKTPTVLIRAPELLSLVIDGHEVESLVDQSTHGVDLGSYNGAVWDGFLVYRTVVLRSDLEKITSDHGALSSPLTFYMAQDCNLVVFPIARNTAFNIAIYIFDPEGAKTREPYAGKIIANANTSDILQKIGGNWEREVLQLLSCITSPKMRQWAVNEVEELPTYTRGRVVLIGDAAHAIMPSLGMGAGQAIEDAYVLAALLSHPLAQTHPESALETFSRVRLPFMRSVSLLSRKIGLYYAFRDENTNILNLVDGTDQTGLSPDNDSRITLSELGRRLVNSFAWTGRDASSERALALRLLESQVSKLLSTCI